MKQVLMWCMLLVILLFYSIMFIPNWIFVFMHKLLHLNYYVLSPKLLVLSYRIEHKRTDFFLTIYRKYKKAFNL